jgi:peptidyl-prolyl cis-trans isomerase D
MFESIRKHTRLLALVLFPLIALSFVFVQGYDSFTDTRGRAVAKVDGKDITQAEWDAAHKTQVDNLRRQIPDVDAKLFDNPAARNQALEGLVNERLILAAANRANFLVSDEQIIRNYREDPRMAALRNPDGTINQEMLKNVLAAQNMSIAQFEQELRRDLSGRQVTAVIGTSALAPAAAASSALGAMYQQREIQVQRFESKDYESKVTITPAEIEAYYKDSSNAPQFQSLETADVQYVVLDLDALKKGLKVNEDDLQTYYKQNLVRYTTPEERRASHILIKASPSMPEADRAKAKARAEALLAEVRKNPASFADVARKNSQDEGSAPQGGDLDFFRRGAMTAPFEQAVFAMKPGQISDVVATDFGFHIIQLVAVRDGEVRPLEAVRAELTDELAKQQAQKRYSEAALEFTNMVYEQSDSLQPVVDKLGLQVQNASGVTRAMPPGTKGALGSTKLLQAIFSDDALKNKRNTEAVEVGPNQLAAARVVKHHPAALLPLDQVRDQIRRTLVAKRSAELARKDGEARLAALKKTPADIGETKVISRSQTHDFTNGIVEAALKASPSPLPAFVGVDMADAGYAVAKVVKVLGPDPAATEAQRARSQYQQAWAQAEASAYSKALRERFKVKIKVDAVAEAAAKEAKNEK